MRWRKENQYRGERVNSICELSQIGSAVRDNLRPPPGDS